MRDDVVNMTLEIAERVMAQKLDREKDRELVAQLLDDMQQGKVEGLA